MGSVKLYNNNSKEFKQRKLQTNASEHVYKNYNYAHLYKQQKEKLKAWQKHVAIDTQSSHSDRSGDVCTTIALIMIIVPYSYKRTCPPCRTNIIVYRTSIIVRLYEYGTLIMYSITFYTHSLLINLLRSQFPCVGIISVDHFLHSLHFWVHAVLVRPI